MTRGRKSEFCEDKKLKLGYKILEAKGYFLGLLRREGMFIHPEKPLL